MNINITVCERVDRIMKGKITKWKGKERKEGKKNRASLFYTSLYNS